MPVQIAREELRLRAHLARARKKGLPATITLPEWLAIIAEFNELCAYCRQQPFEALDHLIPMNMGGGTTPDNCLPCCDLCNARKTDRCLDMDFSGMSLDEITRLIYTDVISARNRRFSYLKKKKREPRTARRDIYTPQQIADMVQVDKAMVLRWLRSGQLIGSKFGSKLWRIQRKDFDKFMEDRRQESA